MSKFRINTDQQIPTDEFIKQHKPSFESMAAKVNPVKNPMRKLWQWGGGSALVIVSAVSLYWLTSSNNTSTTNESTTINDSIACVNAPIDEIDVPKHTYTFNNQDGGTFITGEGTRIIVPQNAFADENGQLTQGPVDLVFREFHKVPDFFRAGIPMTYDSAGETYTFESAGMFELLAFAGDEPLQVAKGKELFVDLVSSDNSPKHNVYYLDTVADKWNYLAESTFREMEEPETTEDSQPDYTYAFDNGSSNDVADRFYVKPVQAGKATYLFKAEYEKSQFPELSIYENVLFEVDESRQEFSNDLYKVNWASVTIKKSKMDGLYMLKLSRPDTTVKLYAKPVFAAADYQNAVARYNKKGSDQQQAVANYRSRADSTVANRDQAISMGTSNYQGYRRVSVTRSGIYNHDYPIRIDNTFIKPTFTENGSPIVPARIYWTDKSVNAMYEAQGNAEALYFTKGAPIILWVVDEQNRMAVVSESEFARATKKNDNPVFDLTFLDAREGLKTLNEEIYGKTYTPETASLTSQVSADEQASVSMTCFPNPVSTTLNIRISGNTQYYNSSLMIISSNGNMVQQMSLGASSETLECNVSSLQPGVYFLQLNLSSGRSVNQRFVKQ